MAYFDQVEIRLAERLSGHLLKKIIAVVWIVAIAGVQALSYRVASPTLKWLSCNFAKCSSHDSASSSSAMAAFSAGRCTNTHLLKHTQSQIYDKSTDNRWLPTLRGVRVLASIALLLMLHADSVSFHSTFNPVALCDRFAVLPGRLSTLKGAVAGK